MCRSVDLDQPFQEQDGCRKSNTVLTLLGFQANKRAQQLLMALSKKLETILGVNLNQSQPNSASRTVEQLGMNRDVRRRCKDLHWLG